MNSMTLNFRIKSPLTMWWRFIVLVLSIVIIIITLPFDDGRPVISDIDYFGPVISDAFYIIILVLISLISNGHFIR